MLFNLKTCHFVFSVGFTKSTNDTSKSQPVVPAGSSSTTSFLGSTPSTPNITGELKVSSRLRRFSFNELKSATRNFKPESLLGEGGFGCVYKGWISENGCNLVRAGSGIPIVAEIVYLGELMHSNLVKLIGYCIEDDQRLLVYEFMPRGSLENHLFRRSLSLTWSIRMKIAFGAAKGLTFLHQEAERPAIYRDFITSNILLDSDYNAELSDFGLAKDAPEGDKTHVSTRVMGTYGPMVMQHLRHLISRSDVYSFGVVLLELVIGRRSMDKNRPVGEYNLVEWAQPYLGDKRWFYRLLDPRLEGHFSIIGSQKALQLAARCLSRDPKARPLMSEVVEVLTPLPKMKHMASSSSSYFQALQAERAAATAIARIDSRSGARFSRNAQPNRSLSASNGPNCSPYQLNHRQWSPHAQPNRSLFAFHGPNGSPYQQPFPTSQPKRSLSVSNGPKG
ncbi:hypothetical protein UlMin_014773 [Ulmus minor]